MSNSRMAVHMAKAAAQRGPSRMTTLVAGSKRSLTSTCLTQKSAVGVIQATNTPVAGVFPSFATLNNNNNSKKSSTRQPSPRLKQLASNVAAMLDDSDLAVEPSTNDNRDNGINANMDDTNFDMSELRRLAALAPTPLRLGDMYKYGASADLSQRLRNAQFLHRELPIRLAQRSYDLLSLPHGLSSESTPIRQVALQYIDYIQKLKEFPMPTTPQEEEAFTQLLHSMVLDRTSIPTRISQGLMEWLGDPRASGWGVERQQEMEDALVRFFTARVGLRFLTEHHILSSAAHPKTALGLRQTQTPCPLSEVQEQDRGCIQHDCDAVRECETVAQEVARQTYDCYGMCPEIEIVDRQSPEAQVFTYVPHHLHYMLAELLKNSCRASVERYMKEGGQTSTTASIPPVRVVIVKGKNEVTIKVSDQGGGIPRSTMARIFKFTHSTSRQDYENDTDFGTVEAGIQHMRGFGLPLARIYARYFGGELTLKSMEGYGLDAYLYLPRLGDACENLPKRVLASPGQKVSLPSKRPSPQPSSTGSGSSSQRTFSTMITNEGKKKINLKLHRVITGPTPQLQASRSFHLEPWVMDPRDDLDASEWEEAKMRKIMNILSMRAL